ncbi:MAG: hypothetical protein COU08_01260 [Candidatus Harrisonbacteria bacterium CG10_big_fil_rev_8_21_14_0_10_42_17]|uniref:Aminoacyl-tRNA hydrolase n=1 Tax=Candidatus Harrisonbacteria bacterium CG10_big_fil_rev_8_21_14_0_10_42_17 TaxID=1974584 RepID=A0A2M6WII6_9BACT|nr:MAG: hypothetical protein COU08_01260 [Candidatus Harrisonbacteria bacterium CG10_big_fil_rev_8_21_14_0_10_42_17]
MIYKLIIGLGNAEKQYNNTYHNVGALAALRASKINALKSAVILGPSGYMNHSGQVIKKELKKHDAKPEELLVIHDDSDLMQGTYKISTGRGAGGHKGVEDIIHHLKTKEFTRLRIGIRPHEKTGKHHEKASKFVLKKISKENLQVIETVIEKALSEFIEIAKK